MGCSSSNNNNTQTYNKREELTNDFINPDFDENFEVSLGKLGVKNLTTIDLIEKSFQNNGENQTLGYRKYINDKEFEQNFTFTSYKELENMSKNLSTTFINRDLAKPIYFEEEKCDFKFIGIFARNCLEWILTDIACQMNDICSVTFYATLGDKAFDHISNQTKLSTICVSGDNIKQLLKYHSMYNLVMLKKVIIYDYTLEVPKNAIKDLESAGFQVILFTELLNDTPNKLKLNYAKPDSILTISYTSGTTGIPKGVKISQNSVALMIEYAFQNAEVFYSPKETVLLYLPLAHVMERLNSLACLCNGVTTGFLSGDVRTTLSDDIEILKPTIFVAVPRVLQLFRQKILDIVEKLPDGCKKNLAQRALRVKRENFRNNGSMSHTFYDNLVFNKIRQKFGGRIKHFITGSAPLAEDVAIDIKVIFGATIIEAYGLTECCGACVTTKGKDVSNTSAGGSLKVCKIKLVDVPEMKYHQNTLLNEEISPSGEVCIYGPILFRGYFCNEKATKECMDPDGWFHTGDIGRIMPNDKGLKIIDRKKEIFKLAQGEYIAPTKLEFVYSKCRYVLNICVYGNSFKNFLVAIIVPNRDIVFEFLKRTGKTQKENLKEISDIEKYFTDVELLKEIKTELDNLATENSFNSLEKIPKFYLSPFEFTIQNGCFTPTLKVARNVIANVYKSEIDMLYG
jgi:long-chain acyl-CoA synthetase